MCQGKDPTDPRIKPKLQSHTQTNLQGSSHDGDRPGQGRAITQPLPAAARRRYETHPGQAYPRTANLFYCIVDVEITGGVRPEKIKPNNIAHLGVGSITSERVNIQWHHTWRQNGYRGEHPSKSWSWILDPESPRIGYAPLESRIKRWAKESPIEGWFPPRSGERQSCNVDRDAFGMLMLNHWKYKHPWISPRMSWVFLQRQSADQLFRPVGADAGCKTTCSKREGKVCLDTLPHRRDFERHFPLAAFILQPPHLPIHR